MKQQLASIDYVGGIIKRRMGRLTATPLSADSHTVICMMDSIFLMFCNTSQNYYCCFTVINKANSTAYTLAIRP